jgi:hypothetical protein
MEPASGGSDKLDESNTSAKKQKALKRRVIADDEDDDDECIDAKREGPNIEADKESSGGNSSESFATATASPNTSTESSPYEKNKLLLELLKSQIKHVIEISAVKNYGLSAPVTDTILCASLVGLDETVIVLLLRHYDKIDGQWQNQVRVRIRIVIRLKARLKANSLPSASNSNFNPCNLGSFCS